MTPQEACLDALKRVARNFDSNHTRLAKIGLDFYALRKDGAYAGATLWQDSKRPGFVVNEGGESRYEPLIFLFER